MVRVEYRYRNGRRRQYQTVQEEIDGTYRRSRRDHYGNRAGNQYASTEKVRIRRPGVSTDMTNLKRLTAIFIMASGIGTGVYLIHPPATVLSVALYIWYDVYIGVKK